MNINPPAPPGQAPPSFKGSPKARSQDDSHASAAERDAQNRIDQAQTRAVAAEQADEAQVQDLQAEYTRQTLAETQREETAYEAQRRKGYEMIRDLQRTQQAELNRIRREGEREIQKAGDYYRNTLYGTEMKGNEDLKGLETRQAQEMSYQDRTRTAELEETRREQELALTRLKDQGEEKYNHIAQESRKEYDRMVGNSATANEQADHHFQENYQKTLAGHRKVLDRLDSAAAKRFQELRQDTAQKLSAYSSRQRDPFYRLVDLHARLSDEGDEYVLTARVPEHEQQHVSVAIKGDNVVVSGYRRSEEKLDLGTGHFKGTAAYQSYQESFPLTWPVEGHQMSREFRGDELVVRIPKKNEYVYRSPAKPIPERSRVERPQFPENLPTSPQVAEAPPEAAGRPLAPTDDA